METCKSVQKSGEQGRLANKLFSEPADEMWRIISDDHWAVLIELKNRLFGINHPRSGYPLSNMTKEELLAESKHQRGLRTAREWAIKRELGIWKCENLPVPVSFYVLPEFEKLRTEQIL